jgi:hypothetical protein
MEINGESIIQAVNPSPKGLSVKIALNKAPQALEFRTDIEYQ